jgi:hypothetical protein
MNMRKILLGGLVATGAMAGSIALASSATATAPSVSTCTPSHATAEVTHLEYKWAALVAKPTLHWDYKWTASTKNPSTDLLHIWVPSLDLTKKGLPQITRSVVDVEAKDAVTCPVSLPEHFAGEGTYAVVVPFVKGVDTFLMGVQGYDEHVAITQDVTVTKAMAGQFWIGHKAQDGYVIANPNTAQWHIDFAFAHSTKATGDVSWDFGHGQVTGTVKFDVDATNGGTLDYQADNGIWLHGVITPGTYQQIDAHTAVFGGEITSGSDDYTVNHPGTDYFTVKIVDGGTNGNGDIVAVLANQDGFGNWLTSADATPSIDYPMDAAHAGMVTAGNLTIA